MSVENKASRRPQCQLPRAGLFFTGRINNGCVSSLFAKFTYAAAALQWFYLRYYSTHNARNIVINENRTINSYPQHQVWRWQAMVLRSGFNAPIIQMLFAVWNEIQNNCQESFATNDRVSWACSPRLFLNAGVVQDLWWWTFSLHRTGCAYWYSTCRLPVALNYKQ